MLGTIITICFAVAFCIFVMTVTLMDVLKSRKEVPDGILFVSKNSGEIYANMYIDPIELEDGTIIKMAIAHLDTK